jgi:hypothetical protein
MQQMFEAMGKLIDHIKDENNNRKLSHHCAACGATITYMSNTPQKFIAYGKPDTWLCWSCNYDYKKFAQDERIETFYRLMKGE